MDDGARGAYVAPFTHDGRPLGHPDNDPVFAAAQDLDVPFAIHPTFEPQWTKGARMGTWENVKQLRLLASVTASDGVRHQFTTLFDYGVFDKFPRLKVIVLESGGGWIGYWLDRIDAVYGHTFIGTRVPLEHKPSDYFRERIWISCDPDERTIPALAERFGDRFLWASDFPHADHTPEYIGDLDELVDSFPEARRRRVPRRQRSLAVRHHRLMGDLPTTIPGVVRRAAELFGAREGVVDGDVRLSFAELAVADRPGRPRARSPAASSPATASPSGPPTSTSGRSPRSARTRSAAS